MKQYFLQAFLFAILSFTFSECYSGYKTITLRVAQGYTANINQPNPGKVNEKFDFTASWKKHTKKNIIVIKITGGSEMMSCYIYDAPPFTGGKLIRQANGISSQKFEIEMEKKEKVYIWISKDEENIAAKWLNISK